MELVAFFADHVLPGFIAFLQKVKLEDTTLSRGDIHLVSNSTRQTTRLASGVVQIVSSGLSRLRRGRHVLRDPWMFEVMGDLSAQAIELWPPFQPDAEDGHDP